MKLKFGMIATNARGSLGGHSVAQNASGIIIITKPKPRHRHTRLSSLVNNFRNTAVQAYKLLTPAQQALWLAERLNYPRVDTIGNTYLMTAQQLYVSININQQLLGSSIINVPAAKRIPPMCVIDSVAPNSGGGVITVSYLNPLTADPSTFIVKASPPMSNGRSAIQSQLRIITRVSPVGQSSTNIFSPWVATFGALMVGQRIFVQMYAIDNTSGAASPSSTNYGVTT